MKLWKGRLGDSQADELMAFTQSLSFDKRLAEFDLTNSRAHVRGLLESGIITEKDASDIFVALEKVAEEVSENKFQYEEGDEDIHSAVERRVTELAGPAGAKLHTGRSRNDQVVTDLRLYTKRALTLVAEGVLELQETLWNLANEAGDTYLPGYTHLQHAQSVLLSHYLLAHAWALTRDVDRLLEARRRADVSPLGAGALGGSSLPLQPDLVAKELGFAERFQNSLDAVSDRDFVADSLYAISILFIHLSRASEEVILWTSQEFGFMTLDDKYSTGSSMLPQKKNPDIAELARAKAGRMIGNLSGFLATLKGLPLSYNRDLQEDKEPLFDAIDQATLALSALIGLYKTAQFNDEAMRDRASDPEMNAVDLAEFLVGKGMPFREAHEIVGDIVRQAHERHVPLSELVEARPELGREAVELLTPGSSIARRQSPGGAGHASVNEQLQQMKNQLAADRQRIGE